MIVRKILCGRNMMKNESKIEIDKFGTKMWRLPNGHLHREDGPAIEYKNSYKHQNGSKHWYLNGKLHREDGPAIEFANGHKEWYLDDRLYKIQNDDRIIERDKDFDCNTCVSQIVCDYDCQWVIMDKEYCEK